MINEYRKIEWPIEIEDDDGNEYFICPCCEGSGIACKGTCVDMGDERMTMMVQVEPDWPCGLCDGEGLVEKGSESHFCLIRNTVLEILTNTFGQEKIDNLPHDKFKEFYANFDRVFQILKPIWVKTQPSKQSVAPER